MLTLLREDRVINIPARLKPEQVCSQTEWEAIWTQCFEELNPIQLKYKGTLSLHLWTNQIRCEWQAAELQKQTIIVSCYPSVWSAERVKWAAVSPYSRKQTHLKPPGSSRVWILLFTQRGWWLFRGKWFNWISLEAFVLMSYLLMSSFRIYEPQAKPDAFVWPQTHKKSISLAITVLTNENRFCMFQLLRFSNARIIVAQRH